VALFSRSRIFGENIVNIKNALITLMLFMCSTAWADRAPIQVTMVYQFCDDQVCIDQFTICMGETWSVNRRHYLRCTAPVESRNVMMGIDEQVSCRADSVFYEDGATGIVCHTQIQLVGIAKDGFESGSRDG
jgi:hypothetical protein